MAYQFVMFARAIAATPSADGNKVNEQLTVAFDANCLLRMGAILSFSSPMRVRISLFPLRLRARRQTRRIRWHCNLPLRLSESEPPQPIGIDAFSRDSKWHGTLFTQSPPSHSSLKPSCSGLYQCAISHVKGCRCVIERAWTIQAQPALTTPSLPRPHIATLIVCNCLNIIYAAHELDNQQATSAIRAHLVG